jgi:hypothetical protein
MILTLIQDTGLQGGVSEAALRTIEEAFHAESGEELSRADLEQDIADARAAEMDPLIDLIRLSQQLKPRGASTVLKYAFLAAAAAGSLSEAHSSFLQELREALGVSEVGFRRIIAAASETPAGQKTAGQNTGDPETQP